MQRNGPKIGEKGHGEAHLQGGGTAKRQLGKRGVGRARLPFALALLRPAAYQAVDRQMLGLRMPKRSPNPPSRTL